MQMHVITYMFWAAAITPHFLSTLLSALADLAISWIGSPLKQQMGNVLVLVPDGSGIGRASASSQYSVCRMCGS
jgi:hypothetical protein